MTTNNPTIVGGLVYDELTLSMAVSPKLNYNSLSASVVLSMQPMRRDNGVLQILTEPEYTKTLIFSDVFAANDVDVLLAAGKVQAALQELINKKGL